MYAAPERVTQPAREVGDEFLAEVRPVSRAALLKRVVEVLVWDLGDVDRVATEIIEVMRDQTEPASHWHVEPSVHSVWMVHAAVLPEGNLFIDPHCVDQPPAPGAVGHIRPARSGDPVARFCHFDDVPFPLAELAFRQGAKAVKRVRRVPEIVIDDVREEPWRRLCASN
jgi:hypothetical protein